MKEAGTKPFNDVKEDVEKDIRKDKAQEFVRTMAKRAFNRLFKSKNIEDYAKKNGIKLSETAYFTYGGLLEDAESNDLFSKESFALLPGELAPAFAIGQKYFLVKLLDRKESSIPPIEDVKTRIVKELEEKKKIELTMEKAQNILSQLMNGKEEWENVGKKYDLSIKEAELKRSSDYIQEIGQANQKKESKYFHSKNYCH